MSSSQFFIDNLNDNVRDTNRWLILSHNGGTANETGQQLQVVIPSGAGSAQAGYVTNDHFTLYEHITKVNVPSRGNLDEVSLLLCKRTGAPVTTSDPAEQNNWYKIQKTGDSSFRVQRRVGDGVVETLSTFTSSSQQLSVRIQDGTIYFGDGVTEQWMESVNAAIGNDFYVYVYVNSEKGTVNKTGAFTNFAISPIIRRLNENNFRADCNCYIDSTEHGKRGITIWGPADLPNVIPKNGGVSPGLMFTPTQPKGYSYKDFCLVTYTVHAESNSTNDTIGGVVMNIYKEVINPPFPPDWEVVSVEPATYISKIQGHDVTQTVDLAPMSTYEDTKRMYISFTNNDPQVDISIKGFQIVRGYQMYSLDQQNGLPEDQTQDGTYDFSTRLDYPCSFEKCGGMSYTGFMHDNRYFQQIVNNYQPEGAILTRGTTYQWDWTNPTATFTSFNGNTNYVAKAHCLFNFNNVTFCDDNGSPLSEASGSVQDVPFQMKINDSNWYAFYHSKKSNHLAHSVDLATHSYLSAFYRDGPGLSNTLYLRVLDNPDPGVNFLLVDGAGLVNLYRIYQTKPCCPTIASSKTGNGTISPTPGPFVIPIQGKPFDMSANNGNYLSNVAVDGTSKGTSDPYTVQYSDLSPAIGMEGHTITATFTPNPVTYTISTSITSGFGTITPSYTTVSEGSTPSFSINAANCFNITAVSIDNGTPIHPNSPAYTLTLDPVYSNHSIAVTFSVASSDHTPVVLQIDDGLQLPTPVPVSFVADGVSYSPNEVACLTTNGTHLFSVSPIADYGGSDRFSFEKWDVLDGGANHIRYEYCNPLAMQVTSSTQFLAAMYTTETTMYTVTSSAGSNGSITPSQATVLQGSCATFKITPATGYQLQTLQYNGNDIKNNVLNSFITVDVQGSGTLVASFSIITYTITASVSGGGGSISPSGSVSVNHGGSQNFTLTPNSGYHLSSLVRSDTGSVLSEVVNNQYTASNVNANFSLTASFAINTYTITASVSSGYGSISPSGEVTVNQGGSQPFTITPTPGHSIHAVTVDGTSVGAVSTYQFTDVQEDHTIQAAFLPLYAITSAAGTGGTISPLGTTLVIQGGSQSYTITPNEGYSIYTVYVNGQWQGAISTYTFTNVQASQPIEAFFQHITYGIVSSAGAGGSISPSGGTIVNWGGSQSYYITPNYGYLIADVTVDGYSQGAISYYPFTNVQANHTISATFEYCQSCYECQTPCDVCQACYTCQTSCELSCQTGCEVACQTTCELSCQTGCEVSCQTGCEIACQTGCQVSCQTGCEVTCQTGCEVSCQSCNTCQTTCELSCQTGCQVSCQWGCEVNCQDECYITCQSCVNCQSSCELACQDCQTGCQVSCQDCQSCVECQTSETCPSGYYECQSCETCQVGCEVACQDSCQLACQNCYTSCESCNNCQVCVSCETSEWCPSGYYECQSCETCQPAYT